LKQIQYSYSSTHKIENHFL